MRTYVYLLLFSALALTLYLTPSDTQPLSRSEFNECMAKHYRSFQSDVYRVCEEMLNRGDSHLSFTVLHSDRSMRHERVVARR